MSIPDHSGPFRGPVLRRQQPRKKITRQPPIPEKPQSGLARLLSANEYEEEPLSEYICVNKDADYLRRDVDGTTLGIFRISGCVAALIERLPSLA